MFVLLENFNSIDVGLILLNAFLAEQIVGLIVLFLVSLSMCKSQIQAHWVDSPGGHLLERVTGGGGATIFWVPFSELFVRSKSRFHFFFDRSMSHFYVFIHSRSQSFLLFALGCQK